MSTLTTPKITASPLIEQLMSVEGKAEIVGGEIVEIEMTGDRPSYAAGEVFFSLRQYVQETGVGRAVQDGAGFLCDLPNRQSFSPDAAFYDGPSGERGFFP